MDASEVTRRLRERTLYASFLRQRTRVEGGCGTSIRIQNGGGSFDASLVPMIKEGDLFTTPEETDALVAAAACTVSLRESVYIVGQFQNSTVDFFDASTGQPTTVSKVDPSADWATYVMKINKNGSPVWGTHVNAVITDNSENAGTDVPVVAVAPDGSVYVTGFSWFNSGDNRAMHFYNAGSSTPDVVVPITTGKSNVYWIVKYNTDGVIQWVNYIAGNSFDRSFLATGSSNQLYIQFYSVSELDLYNVGDLVNVAETIPLMTESYDVYVFAMDQTGQRLWHSVLAGWGDEYQASMCTDSVDNVYVAVKRTNLVNMDIYVSPNLSSPAFSLAPSFTGGNEYNSIVKYNAQGVVQWGTNLSGSNSAGRCMMAVDSSDNLYAAAMYRNGILNVYSAGDLEIPTTVLPPVGGWNLYTVKFSPLGVVQWAKYMIGEYSEQQPSVGMDGNDRVTVVGESTSDFLYLGFGPDEPSETVNFGFSGGKIFALQMDTAGASIWSAYIGPVSPSSRNSTSVSGDGSVVIGFVNYDGDTFDIYDATHTAVVTGCQNTSGSSFARIVTYTSTGSLSWYANSTPSALPQLST